VSPPEQLTCGNAWLRRWHRDDLAALLTARSTSEQHLREWMPWAQDAPTEQAVLGFLERTELDWHSGTGFHYALTGADTGAAVLGSFSLMARIGPGALEIGYWVDAGYTRQGRATAAAAALTRAGFGLAGVSHLEIHVDRENLASRGVPAKLGYTLVDTREVEPAALNESGQLEIWRMTRLQWPSSAAAARCDAEAAAR